MQIKKLRIIIKKGNLFVIALIRKKENIVVINVINDQTHGCKIKKGSKV